MAFAIKLWDILAWVFVAFPLLTGGVWIKRPGLFIELSEITIPVLALAIWAFWLQTKAGVDLFKQSSLLRAGSGLWQRWKSKLEQSPKVTLWAAAIAFGAIWSLASLKRHWAFGSGAADLGIFTSAIWNLSHGYGYVSSVKNGLNLFADHQSPIFWGLVPIFKLFPFPETLLISQGFTLASGGVAAYFVGTQYLPRGHWARAAIPLLYWAYPPLRNANAFDFHPEVFMLPIFLASIYGLQSEKWLWRFLGILFFALGLACKESAGPVAVGLGMGWLLGAGPIVTRRWTRVWGALAAILGVSVFLFDTKWVPNQFGGAYVYNDAYQLWGKGLGDLILAPITQPVRFWTHVLGPKRLLFLFKTLTPLALAPLFAPRALVAALPGYAILFLTEGDHRVSLIYHYSIEPSVGLFWALPVGLLTLESRFWKRWNLDSKLAASTWVLFCALALHGRSEGFRIRYHHPNAHQKWVSSEVIPCIQDMASLSVTGALVPHLATRQWVNHLPLLEIPTQKNNLVQCVILDRSGEINQWPMDTASVALLPKTLEERSYQSIYRCESLEIFASLASGGSEQSCLRCQPRCAPQ